MKDQPAERLESSPELALLLLGMRHCLGQSLKTPEIESTLSRVDWSQVLWLGRRQGALLFLREMLNASTAALAPAGIRAQLQALVEVNEWQGLDRAREVCQIHDRFSQAGLSASVLDGWALARRHYSRPLWRETGKFSTFSVGRADLKRAQEVLRVAGYTFWRAREKEALIDSKNQVNLISEWDDGRAHGESGQAVAAPGETVLVGGRRIGILSAGEWLCFLSRRLVDKGGGPLVHAFDIVAVGRSIRESDWPAVIRQADESGMQRVLQSALAACYERLREPLPPPLLDRWAVRPALMRAARAIKERMGSEAPRQPGLLFRIRLMLALRSRVPRRPQVVSSIGRRGAIQEALTPPVTEGMLQLAEVGAHDVVYELGCMDGAIAIAAAKRRDARSVGVDLNPRWIVAARDKAAEAGVADRTAFFCCETDAANLSEATVVILSPAALQDRRLRRTLRQQLRPGTRVVSRDFTFPDSPPESTVLVRDGRARIAQIFLWHVK